LQRVRRRAGELWVRPVRELRQPQLDGSAIEPARELGFEPPEVAEADVRPRLRGAGLLAVAAWVRMVRPAVEREVRRSGGDEPREVRRRLAVVETRQRPVVAARRSLACG